MIALKSCQVSLGGSHAREIKKHNILQGVKSGVQNITPSMEVGGMTNTNKRLGARGRHLTDFISKTN